MSRAYTSPEIQSQRPDCLLADLVMAEVDSLELWREVRAFRSVAVCRIGTVPARPRDLWPERALTADAGGYILKGGLKRVSGASEQTLAMPILEGRLRC